jgi:hypothetical protein
MTISGLLSSEFSLFLSGTTVRSAIIMYIFELDAESALKKGKGPYLGIFDGNNINIKNP